MRQDKLFMVELSTPFTPFAWPIHGLLSSIFLHWEKAAVFTKTTEAQIDSVICPISERRTNRHMSPRVPAFLVETISQPIYDKSARRTAHFHVEDSCIGCGLCAKKCPVQAIEMQASKPVWVKDKCVMCLGCLHRCPKFAIQYGRNTKKHGQYTNPNVKL
ncbi:MAG: EFR1 family ferrodoxin [Oscillospiraceae bacterium]